MIWLIQNRKVFDEYIHKIHKWIAHKKYNNPSLINKSTSLQGNVDKVFSTEKDMGSSL